MSKYESGDIATYWFVIIKERDGSKRIQAFSDSKALVKFYMELHNSPRFSLRSMTAPIDEIIPILNENSNDEIHIENILTRDSKAKKGENCMKMVQIPMTGTESILLRDDTAEFLNSSIPYGYLNGAIPYLKDKWQRALADIFLTDIIRKVVHHQTTRRLQDLQVDQASMLIRIPQGNFGL